MVTTPEGQTDFQANEPRSENTFDKTTVCGICGQPLRFGGHNHLLDRILDKLMSREHPDKKVKSCIRCGVQVDANSTVCSNCQQKF